MRSLFSADQSLALDALVRGKYAFSNDMLMEIAAIKIWTALKECFADVSFQHTNLRYAFENSRTISIAAICGKGDNAGDALALLRHAKFEGYSDLTVYIVSEYEMKDAAKINLKRAEQAGIRVIPFESLERAALLRELEKADILLDGVLGTGTKGAAQGIAARMIQALNALKENSPTNNAVPFIVSIDVPSGLSDAWEQEFPVVRSDMTLCIEPLKQALYRPETRPFAGQIVQVSGIFPLWEQEAFSLAKLVEIDDVPGYLPPISEWAHKMQRGRVAILAGSKSSAGAALYCLKGALASGAGYVALYCDKELYPVYLQEAADYAMIKPFSEKDFLPEDWDVIVVGPGWGTSPQKVTILKRLLNSSTPLILDADAIRMFATISTEHKPLSTPWAAPLILTPHPGEFKDLLRLLPFENSTVAEIRSKFIQQLSSMAHAFSAYIALRASTTHVCSPDGECAVFDGSAYGLGIAGSGDVLSGLAGGLLARWIRSEPQDGQGAEESMSARQTSLFKKAIIGAVLVHGLAGKRLSRSIGWFSPADLARECAFLTSKHPVDFWSTIDE